MEKSVFRAEPLTIAAQISLTKWFLMISKNDFGDLPSIVASDAVFHSPIEWQPYPGRDLVCLLLRTAATVYKDFKYISELSGDATAVLEFSAHIGDIQARGVHIIRFNADGEFADIDKMLRPEQAVKALGHEMGAKIGAQTKVALSKT
jgi:hypothetical protein